MQIQLSSSVGQVAPARLVLESADDKHEFKVNLDCSKQASHYADVKVQFQIGDEREIFQYKVVCDKNQLNRPDMNMFVLFGLAVGIVYVAFHTPEL